jgi:microsomal dipeptidase-like Zn-dependent dipeptidase
VPRLLEGNVAIQTFSIVSKVPRGLNIKRNKSDSDDIGLLSLVDRWPPNAVLNLKDRVLYQANKLSEFAKDSNGKLRVIRFSEDMDEFLSDRTRSRNCVGGILSIEGAHPIDGDLKNIEAFVDAGVRMIGVAHFFDNEFAGSAHGEAKGGLTDKGRELVKELQKRSVIVDVAHSSPSAIQDILAIATKPVVASHTGVRGTCANERNLSDEDVRGIAHTGGLIGIGFWRTAVCGDDAKAIARAMKYAVKVAGIKHVALGSDFDGAVTAPFDCSKMMFVTQALIDEGFSDDQIRAVMGGNAVRFYREQLPHRPSGR